MLDFFIIFFFLFSISPPAPPPVTWKKVRGEESGSGSAGWRGGRDASFFLPLGFDVVLIVVIVVLSCPFCATLCFIVLVLLVFLVHFLVLFIVYLRLAVLLILLSVGGGIFAVLLLFRQLLLFQVLCRDFRSGVDFCVCHCFRVNKIKDG